MEFELNKKCVRTMPRIPFTEFQFDFPEENENGSTKVKMDIAYPTPEEYKKRIITNNTERKRKEIYAKIFKYPRIIKTLLLRI